MITNGMFTSNTDEWATPQWLFDTLNNEFHFDVDVCADHKNHKCDKYFSKEEDGLSQQWNGVVWCNPPYGNEISKWVEKAYEYFTRGGTVVMLVPARTDTRWWHNYIRKGEVRFIKGRLKFNDGDSPAPFPSAIVIFDNRKDKWWY